MIQDNGGGISNITWTVYGKPKQVTKSGSTIRFSYDPAGNRIIKNVTGSGSGKQYYIRDAQGNILAIYSYDGTTLKWAEQDLYGSSRIGTWDWNGTIPARVMLPQSSTDTLSDWYLLGTRSYELDNHLRNVLSVISDKKIGVSSDNATIDYYKAEVLSQGDYYPFGMEEPYRQYQIGSSYRFGFNGKENDNEIPGWQNYGNREYDRLSGRFISVDPIASKYPELTPYQFASNRPTEGIDQDGLEYWSIKNPGIHLHQQVQLVTAAQLYQQQQRSLLFQQRQATVKSAEPTCVPCEVSQRWEQSKAYASKNLDPLMVGGGDLGYGLNQGLQVALANGLIDAGTAKLFSYFSNGFKNFTRGYEALSSLKLITEEATVNIGIKTPYGLARQSTSALALEISNTVRNGATLYRVGVLGKSETVGAQFWSTENPLELGIEKFGKKYGIPSSNLQGDLFLESGHLKSSSFITREAKNLSGNVTGGIEVVTTPDNVQLSTFSTLKNK